MACSFVDEWRVSPRLAGFHITACTSDCRASASKCSCASLKPRTDERGVCMCVCVYMCVCVRAFVCVCVCLHASGYVLYADVHSKACIHALARRTKSSFQHGKRSRGYMRLLHLPPLSQFPGYFWQKSEEAREKQLTARSDRQKPIDAGPL